jgi:hypothetical protein
MVNEEMFQGDDGKKRKARLDRAFLVMDMTITVAKLSNQLKLGQKEFDKSTDLVLDEIERLQVKLFHDLGVEIGLEMSGKYPGEIELAKIIKKAKAI